MKRKVMPVLNDTLDSYWRRCEGKFLDGWYVKAKNYIEKNMPKNLKLEWINSNYKVIEN